MRSKAWKTAVAAPRWRIPKGQAYIFFEQPGSEARRFVQQARGMQQIIEFVLCTLSTPSQRRRYTKHQHSQASCPAQGTCSSQRASQACPPSLRILDVLLHVHHPTHLVHHLVHLHTQFPRPLVLLLPFIHQLLQLLIVLLPVPLP